MTLKVCLGRCFCLFWTTLRDRSILVSLEQNNGCCSSQETKDIRSRRCWVQERPCSQKGRSQMKFYFLMLSISWFSSRFFQTVFFTCCSFNFSLLLFISCSFSYSSTCAKLFFKKNLGISCFLCYCSCWFISAKQKACSVLSWPLCLDMQKPPMHVWVVWGRLHGTLAHLPLLEWRFESSALSTSLAP